MPRNPEKIAWGKPILRNRHEIIAAMDFFPMYTATYGILYCLFLIGHDRRRILHCDVTRNSSSAWVVRRLREGFPFGIPHNYLIVDHDKKFSFEVIVAIGSMGSKPKRTFIRSPSNSLLPMMVSVKQELIYCFCGPF